MIGKINPLLPHPDWFLDAAESFDGVVMLWRNGRVPKNVEGFLLLTPIRRMLRCFYETNEAAAAALAEMAREEGEEKR